MYKIFVATLLLFPHIASAHGAHQRVEAPAVHSALHSVEGVVVIGVVAIATTVMFRRFFNVQD